jgi:hypothetical protein
VTYTMDTIGKLLPGDDELLTPEEVAVVLKQRPDWVVKACRNGIIDAERMSAGPKQKRFHYRIWGWAIRKYLGASRREQNDAIYQQVRSGSVVAASRPVRLRYGSARRKPDPSPTAIAG